MQEPRSTTPVIDFSVKFDPLAPENLIDIWTNFLKVPFAQDIYQSLSDGIFRLPAGQLQISLADEAISDSKKGFLHAGFVQIEQLHSVTCDRSAMTRKRTWPQWQLPDIVSGIEVTSFLKQFCSAEPYTLLVFLQP